MVDCNMEVQYIWIQQSDCVCVIVADSETGAGLEEDSQSVSGYKRRLKQSGSNVEHITMTEQSHCNETRLGWRCLIHY